MQYIPPTIPIANISIANTTHDLVDRVQTIIDYLNGNPIGSSGNAAIANTANFAVFLAGNVVTTNSSALTLGPGASLYANGTPGANGQVLISNGTSTYWGNTTAVASQWVIGDVPIGSYDGANTVFLTHAPFQINTTIVYLNGLRLRRGAGYDYDESGNTMLVFAVAPVSLDCILVDYLT